MKKILKLDMFQLFLNNIHEYCDAPRPWGIYFQDSAAPQMEALVELHDNIIYYLITILFGVGWVLISIIRNYTSTKSPISHKYLNHGTKNVPRYNNSNSISPPPRRRWDAWWKCFQWNFCSMRSILCAL